MTYNTAKVPVFLLRKINSERKTMPNTRIVSLFLVIVFFLPACGRTALMKAAERGDASEVRALVDAGASVDEKDKWGQTALLCAACGGQTAAVQTLLEAGANIDEKSKKGQTALIRGWYKCGKYSNLHRMRIVLLLTR